MDCQERGEISLDTRVFGGIVCGWMKGASQKPAEGLKNTRLAMTRQFPQEFPLGPCRHMEHERGAFKINREGLCLGS